VSDEEVVGLLTLFDQARAGGAGFEDAVRVALRGVLVSPHFLFRIEEDAGGGGASPVNDNELATRLSYFLWASMPDDELFALAEAGRLREPGVLRAQVERLLADPRSRAFAESFAGQWLGVRLLETSVKPDPRRFPEFEESLRDAMVEEPIAFFHAILRGAGRLDHFLDSDYTYLNEELAAHYGIEGVSGPAMRRVALSDRRRGGALGMGGILTLTSYPRRTSPVLRGKWVLDELLGEPPPPPPPNAGGLPADDRSRDGLTFRQRLEKHREKPECASCHARMDPIGFGLENFDPIGRWREEIRDEPIDASGELTSGASFRGPVELKAILVESRPAFARTLSEKMLAYGLGRGLEYYDRPTVIDLTRKLIESDFRTPDWLVAIVESFPFQHRRSEATRRERL
jgi:hypothetical protein